MYLSFDILFQVARSTTGRGVATCAFSFFFIRQTVPAMPQHTTASVAHKGLRTPRKNEFIEVSELCSACASLLPFSLHPLCEKRKLLEDINAAFTRMVVKEGRVDWAQGLNILESS